MFFISAWITEKFSHRLVPMSGETKIRRRRRDLKITRRLWRRD